jgi:molybdopterin-synthase adenylyltransferase
MTATITDLGRFARQADLVPREQLTVTSASVIGVGAIGRQVALQLAAIGVRQLQLVDFDAVELTNITSQGYWQDDLGQAKATATAAAVQKIDPTIEVETIRDRYRPRIPLCGAVFCCVDAIATRAAIWRIARDCSRFWTDGRMLGEVIRVLTAADVQEREYYGTTLFPAGDAQRGSCTAHSTVYAANITAGLMVHQFTRYLRKLPLDRDLSLNLLASEWSVL